MHTAKTQKNTSIPALENQSVNKLFLRSNRHIFCVILLLNCCFILVGNLSRILPEAILANSYQVIAVLDFMRFGGANFFLFEY